MEQNNIYLGDNLELLMQLDNNSIGSCVSDFPYNLGFMGKKWDTIPNYQNWCLERAKELLRVLKPGAFCLIFGGTRTHHRLVCAFEDAGFEIRDEMQWIYGSGFPKSLDISKAFDKSAGAFRKTIGKYKLPNGQKWNLKQDADPSINHSSGTFTASGNRTLDITAPETELAKQWDGWGTSLKPAQEPIMVARKPLSEKTVLENIIKWGVGCMNIDACRVKYEEGGDLASNPSLRTHINGGNGGKIIATEDERRIVIPNSRGRFPANLILDQDAGRILNEQTGILTSGKINPEGFKGKFSAKIYGKYAHNQIDPNTVYGDSGGASRFFYCPKASQKERTENRQIINDHPTVKPIDLVKYLIKLVTPIGEISLDVCSGSGTHARACIELVRDGYPVNFMGFENDKHSYEISLERIRLSQSQP